VTIPTAPSLSDAAGPPADPLEAVAAWLARAEAESGMQYPNAMTLVTLRDDGQPDGRVVLLKGMDARGFQFYTNYLSAKGRALQTHPEAALVFYWDSLGLQVRVRGRAERLAEAESDAYFQSRPRDSRVGAWASSQSQPIESRAALEAEVVRQTGRFGEEGPVPRPPHWGGFLLVPLEIELWEEGAWRLHNRFLYRRASPEAPWEVQRLQP
jgi:pyridoxamine 5'-phosphate oxidase